MEDGLDTLDLCVALGVPERRAAAARALAERCGVEELLLFVRDPQLGSLIPAPGFPPTLAGGPGWRAFLKQCAKPGRHEATVEFPRGRVREALCVVPDGVAVLFLGGRPHAAELAMVERLMPVLSHALASEQAAQFAAAAAADAHGTASRARSLADALEAARAEQARLNARLRDEHRHKDDFLAMLAHELRNPLTPLVTSIELIRRARGWATEKQLDIMARQVRQLSRLVEDLLDVSRVSRGRIDLRCHALRLEEAVDEALEASRPFLEGRRHRIEVEVQDGAVRVNADNVRLVQVFGNLLHNAGKYTDPGGTIRIKIGRDASHAFVRIQDSGLGIDAALIPTVFDLFTQAPMSLERAQGGLGIGLTLVKALVEMHGGTVEAHSEGLGRGSTFTVRLPVLEGAPAPSQAIPGPEAATTDATDRPMRILVVDDNEDAANSLADVLRLMGHHAQAAFSGLTALHMAEDVEPDLVLLDIGLPEIDGYETARRLRRSIRRRVRLVAVTGYGAEADRRHSREAGFDEHIVKPVMPETLEGIIERARQGAASTTYAT